MTLMLVPLTLTTYVLPFLDVVSATLGMVALSVATWILYRNPSQYDEAYLSVMYVVGILLLFLAVQHPLYGGENITLDDEQIVLARFVILVVVAYWEYIVVSQVLATTDGDPMS